MNRQAQGTGFDTKHDSEGYSLTDRCKAVVTTANESDVLALVVLVSITDGVRFIGNVQKEGLPAVLKLLADQVGDGGELSSALKETVN